MISSRQGTKLRLRRPSVTREEANQPISSTVNLPCKTQLKTVLDSYMETSGTGLPTGGDIPDLNSFAWTAPNPFGDPTPFLLLTPGNEVGIGRLEEFAEALDLQPIGSGGEMPWVGTDYLSVALRGLVADLGTENGSWLKVPVSDQWTSTALSRKYTVLAVGRTITKGEMENDEISEYLRAAPPVRAALVKIRLRVTDE